MIGLIVDTLAKDFGLSNFKTFLWGVNNLSFGTIGVNVAYPFGIGHQDHSMLCQTASLDRKWCSWELHRT